jgi:hypothetical protein
MNQSNRDLKGMDKWALDGFHNLRNHVGDDDRSLLENNQDKLLLIPKAKKLLITASSFDPGTKQLDDVMGYLKNTLNADSGGK